MFLAFARGVLGFIAGGIISLVAFGAAGFWHGVDMNRPNTEFLVWGVASAGGIPAAVLGICWGHVSIIKIGRHKKGVIRGAVIGGGAAWLLSGLSHFNVRLLFFLFASALAGAVFGFPYCAGSRNLSFWALGPHKPKGDSPQ
jgi:hypothetical protein